MGGRGSYSGFKPTYEEFNGTEKITQTFWRPLKKVV